MALGYARAQESPLERLQEKQEAQEQEIDQLRQQLDAQSSGDN